MLLSAKTGRVRETTPLRRLSHKFEKMKNREVIHRLRSIIKEHAEAMGESATAFINRAIDEAMKRDLSE